ncbi:MAG: hypothetical protein Q4G67_14165 [Actinomycetia bacterium]|nr:hypothetical protein [Actinomycetes bacterium]
MATRARLPDLGPGDSGRTFVLGRGTVRTLVLPADADGEDGEPEASGCVQVSRSDRDGEHDRDGGAGVRVYAVRSTAFGPGQVRWGECTWHFIVRGSGSGLARSADDTDAGWGERGGESSHSAQWWQEQRPPHW